MASKVLHVPDPPGTPVIIRITADTAQIKWTRPKTDTHAPITDYIIELIRGEEDKWIPCSKDYTILDPVFTITDLQPCVEYKFRVAARNKNGCGAFSKPSATGKYDNAEFSVIEKISMGNLSVTDMLTLEKIMETTSESIENCFEKLINILLKELVMHNSSCLRSLFHQQHRDFLLDTSAVHLSKEGLNPQDIFLAGFLESLPILRKTIVTKAVLCKIAVPFVVPHWKSDPTLACYALRGVRIPVINEGYQYEVNAYEHEMGIVSFIRLSEELPVSKSEVLNHILTGEGDHEPFTFFNRTFANSEYPRSISNGLIEASFYLPSGKKSDAFREELLFLNLRGNLKYHRCQAKVIRLHSSVVVAFMTKLELAGSLQSFREFYDSVKPTHRQYIIIVILAEAVTKSTVDYALKYAFDSNVPENILLLEAYDSDAVIKKPIDIKYKLQTFISDLQKTKLSMRSIDKAASVIKQENEDLLAMSVAVTQYTLGLAEQLSSDTKAIIMPLQDPWFEWNQLWRELLRQTFVSEEDKQVATNGMQECRNKQIKLLDKGNTPFKTFVEKLILCARTDKVDPYYSHLLYFFEALQMQMDRITLNRFSKHNLEYLKLCKEVATGTVPREGSEAMFEDLDQALGNISLSIHHLMRELAQVYECLRSVEDNGNVLSIYQQTETILYAFAQIVTQGFMFEILDGDSGTIALTWLKSLFETMNIILRHKKVFIISVLGTQSSGKSTLLNSMFGLDFPVSAGGCTRGVYGQFVKAESGYPYDYFLVLDTEGIRGDEDPKTLKNDNEIVTFVIGLSDLVIFNVKGELYADVSDVLQIAVHAFMRMHLHQRSRHCMFVHQNVAAPDAGAKLASRRRKLLHTLNKAVQEVSHIEKVPHITHFFDIVNCKENEHTFYFGDIWNGEPPMAPTNPHYYHNTQSLKDCINDLGKTNAIRPKYLPEIYSIIESLWKGIIAEEFIFQFKTIEDIKSKHDNIQKLAHERAIDLETYVKHYCRDEAIRLFSESQSISELNDKFQLLLKHQEKQTKDIYKKSLKHKSKGEKSSESVEKEALQKLKEVVSLARERRHIQIINEMVTDTEKRETINMIHRKVDRLCKERHHAEMLIEDKFKEVWSQISPLKEIAACMSYKTEVSDFLKNQYTDQQNTIDFVVNDIYVNHQLMLHDIKLVMKWFDLSPSGIDVVSIQKKISKTNTNTRINKMLKDIYQFVEEYGDKQIPCFQDALHEILSQVKHILSEHNGEKDKHGFSFTHKGEIKFAAIILLHAEKFLKSAQKHYEDEQKSKMLERRKLLLEYFENKITARVGTTHL